MSALVSSKRLAIVLVVSQLLAAACASAPPAPTVPPKPTEAPKAAAPAAPPASPQTATSPVAQPAAAPSGNPSPAASPAAASPAAKPAGDSGFFAGKTMRILVGFGTGGGYDLQARLLARHLPRYLTGSPTIIVENKAGAGSLLVANELYNAAPKDGLTLGSFNEELVIAPLLKQDGVQFDPNKFNWLGSPEAGSFACVSRAEAGFTRIQDVVGSSKPLIVGTTGAASGGYRFPVLLNAVAGTNFKVVTGYDSTQKIQLAMESGEVDGVCTTWASLARAKPEWFSTGQVLPLVQPALEKHPDLPDVPLAEEIVKTDEGKLMLRALLVSTAMAKPIAAPPEVPADRIATLRSAIERTYADAEFKAEAERSKLELTTKSGAQLERIVADIQKLSPEVAEKLRTILEAKQG